jgi:hypothetical protein
MGHSCSMAPYPYSRDSTVTLLLGKADSVIAPVGRGRMRTSWLGGHWGPANLFRRVRGQRVRVRRFGGADSALLAAVLASTQDSSVWIVPWDYDAACKPVIWSRFPWSPTDSLGTYTVTLRARRYWFDDRPTFDATAADLEPYPHGAFFRAGYHGTEAIGRGEGLTPEQYFDFYRALPTERPPMFFESPAVLPNSLKRWIEANPALVDRMPAAPVIEAWRRTPGG